MHVQELYRYLIKSCAGERVSELVVTRKGVKYDRVMMVLGDDNQLVSQRASREHGVIDVPQICLVQPRLENNHLTLTAPDMEPLTVPYLFIYGEPIQGRVWKDAGKVLSTGPETSAWFTRFLSRFRPGHYTLVAKSHEWKRSARASHMGVGLADRDPFLMMGQESLDDLNAHLTAVQQPVVPMDQFRPTIVTAGASPYAEDDIKEAHAGTVTIVGGKLCERCPAILVDQEKGKRTSGEPYRTLLRIRPSPYDPMEKKTKNIFGRNFAHTTTGRIREGDEIVVHEWETPGTIPN